jgi:Domain of unknown function (DUF4203)
VTATVGFFWTAGLLYAILDEYTHLDEWLLVFISVVAGFVAAFISAYFWQIGMCALGGQCGTAIGIMILSLADGTVIPVDWARYLFLIVIGLIGFCAILFMQRLGIVFATACVGAFGAAVSLGATLDPYGSLTQTVRGALFDEWDYIVAEWPTYVLFGGWIVATAAGFAVQWMWTAYIIAGKHHDPWIARAGSEHDPIQRRRAKKTPRRSRSSETVPVHSVNW